MVLTLLLTVLLGVAGAFFAVSLETLVRAADNPDEYPEMRPGSFVYRLYQTCLTVAIVVTILMLVLLAPHAEGWLFVPGMAVVGGVAYLATKVLSYLEWRLRDCIDFYRLYMPIDK